MAIIIYFTWKEISVSNYSLYSDWLTSVKGKEIKKIKLNVMRVCSYLTNRMYSHADNYVVHFCFYEMTAKIDVCSVSWRIELNFRTVTYFPERNSIFDCLQLYCPRHGRQRRTTVWRYYLWNGVDAVKYDVICCCFVSLGRFVLQFSGPLWISGPGLYIWALQSW